MKKDMLYPLRCLHGLLAEGPGPLWHRAALRRRLRREQRQFPALVLLAMTPEHGNLGDHAIALAAEQQMKKAGLHPVELTQRELGILWQEGNLSALNGFPIAVNGGGNIGTLWPEVQEMMEHIVEENPDSPMMILPNTAVFEKTEQGKAAQEKAFRCFAGHRNLTVCAREKLSFETMQGQLPNVKLIPDLVLSLSFDSLPEKRQGCILCLRSDRERTLTEGEREKILDQARKLFPASLRELDMVSDRTWIPAAERALCVKQQMEAFASAELVVTDRLHAMIFCAVTGTPCIVLNSRSPKILGCYDWIRHLPYIKMAEDLDLHKAWTEIPRRNHKYDASRLQPYFEELQRELQKLQTRR